MLPWTLFQGALARLLLYFLLWADLVLFAFVAIMLLKIDLLSGTEVAAARYYWGAIAVFVVSAALLVTGRLGVIRESRKNG